MIQVQVEVTVSNELRRVEGYLLGLNMFPFLVLSIVQPSPILLSFYLFHFVFLVSRGTHRDKLVRTKRLAIYGCIYVINTTSLSSCESCTHDRLGPFSRAFCNVR